MIIFHSAAECSPFAKILSITYFEEPRRTVIIFRIDSDSNFAAQIFDHSVTQ